MLNVVKREHMCGCFTEKHYLCIGIDIHKLQQ